MDEHLRGEHKKSMILWSIKVKLQNAVFQNASFLLTVPDQGGADVPDSLELLLALHRHLHWDLVVHWTDCTWVQPGNRLRVLATYLHHRSRGWSQRVRMTTNLKHVVYLLTPEKEAPLPWPDSHLESDLSGSPELPVPSIQFFHLRKT